LAVKAFQEVQTAGRLTDMGNIVVVGSAIAILPCLQPDALRPGSGNLAGCRSVDLNLPGFYLPYADQSRDSFVITKKVIEGLDNEKDSHY
jgi:hypothetical protein